jgi:hypothetical protein
MRARAGYYLDTSPDCWFETPRFAVATPWSNVVEVRQQRRTAGPIIFVLAALLAGVSFVLPGAILLTAGDDGVSKVLGYSLIGAGIIPLIPILPFLFATDADRILYPASSPR